MDQKCNNVILKFQLLEQTPKVHVVQFSITGTLYL